MRSEKFSPTLEKEFLVEARGVVGARRLSSYVNRALRHQLQHDRLSSLLKELAQEKGPIEPEVMAEIRRAWPAPVENAAKRRST